MESLPDSIDALDRLTLENLHLKATIAFSQARAAEAAFNADRDRVFEKYQIDPKRGDNLVLDTGKIDRKAAP